MDQKHNYQFVIPLFEFHTEHLETNPYQEVISMTTIIGIKCDEGIVMASDSLVTSPWAKNVLF